MEVVKSRFEMLPFDILEKIFNLKVFETDDIDVIFYRFYFKNKIKNRLKDFKYILNYDVKYYQHSKGEFKIFKNLLKYDDEYIKKFKWFKCVGCGKCNKNLTSVYFSCRKCFKLRTYDRTKNLLLDKNRIPIIKDNEPVLKDLKNGKIYFNNKLLDEEDLIGLY